jgi:hypothetical protein
MRAALEDIGAGGEMVSEAIMNQIPTAEPGGVEHPRHAPGVNIFPLHFINRPGGSENPAGALMGQGVQPAKWGLLLLQIDQVAFPGQRQSRERFPANNRCRINIGQPMAVIG